MKYEITCNLTFGEIFKQLLIFLLLFIVTFGFAALFFPYYFFKLVLSKTQVTAREIRVQKPNPQNVSFTADKK